MPLGRTNRTSGLATIGFLAFSWVATSAASTPRGGSPIAIPGTIEAADFDEGGPGVAYFDTTFGNSGGAYRDSHVDVQLASDGGYNIGWIGAGEWLNYTVRVPSPGDYI